MITTIEVYWYAIYRQPFKGVYKRDMVVEKNVNRKRKRKCPNINYY